MTSAETKQDVHILKIYKKAQYFGLIYHFYNTDEKNGIEIHPGEFSDLQIRPIKKSKSAIYMGIQLLCDSCYKLRMSRMKFYLFPFINCESIVMGRLSFQMFGISTIVISLAFLFRNYSLWPIVCLVILAYLIIQRTMSAPSINACQHIDDETVFTEINNHRDMINNESLLV